MDRKLFALDQNFPEPYILALQNAIKEAELVPLRAIDPRLPRMDDWQIFHALYADPRPWDGLITADTNMLAQPREMAVLIQTNLTLILPTAAGHDPLRATGLVLTHLPAICAKTTRSAAQIWELSAKSKGHDDPWKYLKALAARAKVEPTEFFANNAMSGADLASNPLA